VAEAFTVRRAGWEDRAGLLDAIDTAFTPSGKPRRDFAREYPWAFTPERIADHFVCEEQGRILGVTGVYPYEARLGGVPFKAAGIGQVSCLPAHRGRGVMTALMNEVVRWMAEAQIELSWLWGDRLRYGRFGWAVGGRVLLFETSGRYLPDPKEAEGARPFDPDRDLERLKAHLDRLPSALAVTQDELRLRIAGQGVGGLVLQESFIITGKSGRRVFFGAGDPQAIQRLLALQFKRLKQENPDARTLEIETTGEPSPLAAVCRACHFRARARQSANFRVGRLEPFLEKACRMVQGRVPGGSGKLELINTDTEEAATALYVKGEFHVLEGAGEDAVRLTTKELSDLFFDWTPPELLLPGLPATSPMRALFGLPLHVSGFFTL